MENINKILEKNNLKLSPGNVHCPLYSAVGTRWFVYCYNNHIMHTLSFFFTVLTSPWSQLFPRTLQLARIPLFHASCASRSSLLSPSRPLWTMRSSFSCASPTLPSVTSWIWWPYWSSFRRVSLQIPLIVVIKWVGIKSALASKYTGYTHKLDETNKQRQL